MCRLVCPRFAVYNFLGEKLPKYEDLKMKLCRSALIGFAASAVSDCVSNSVRVIKVGRWPVYRSTRQGRIDTIRLW